MAEDYMIEPPEPLHQFKYLKFNEWFLEKERVSITTLEISHLKNMINWLNKNQPYDWELRINTIDIELIKRKLEQIYGVE